MIFFSRMLALVAAVLVAAFFIACRNENRTATTPVLPSPTVSMVPLETPMVEPTLTLHRADYSFLTLPVIDAFLVDEAFVADTKKQLGLTGEQMAKLRTVARQETAKLRETGVDTYSLSTAEAHEQAMSTLTEVIGAAKAPEFAKFMFEHWGEEREVASASPTPATNTSPVPSPKANKNTLPTDPNNVPTDTRIVVNSPAYRMDVFKDGQLVKSYKIGIGYPEFPIPVAMRKANTIIFNPTWTPPDWLFGPVWTALYLMMAIAAWLVWRRAGWPSVKGPLGWFAAQLVLNVGWSAIFFGLQLPGAAFAEMFLLWLAITATIIAFWNRSVFAAWLLVPYLGWTTFAAVLNAAIWRLN